jgi:hypothetical protein
MAKHILANHYPSSKPEHVGKYAKSEALKKVVAGKMKSGKCDYCEGGHESKKHYLTTKPYSGTSGMRKGKGGHREY